MMSEKIQIGNSIHEMKQQRKVFAYGTALSYLFSNEVTEVRYREPPSFALWEV